jgi:hypothetical protein
MPKTPPLAVFEDNIIDAERLVHLARVLANTRKRGMRRELRESFGAVMRLSQKDRARLDCVESAELFIVIKPGASGRRDLFRENELRPLLRQAIVATAAAVEAYIAEKTCTYVGAALRSDELPHRLAGLSVNLGEIIDIERGYERRGWGHRKLVADYLVAQASSSPSQIGQVFSLVGKVDVLKAVDADRKVSKGTSYAELEELTRRRNRIAHSGDRSGSGRAPIDADDVMVQVANARTIVESLDRTLG